MVITRYIDVGQTVVSSLSASPLFLIGKDMHDMHVDTNVSEADVGGRETRAARLLRPFRAIKHLLPYWGEQQQ